MSNCPAFKHTIRCANQIQKRILQAKEGEVHNNEVEDFVLRDIDSLNCAFSVLSNACPVLKTFTTVLTYCNDAPAKSLSNCRTIRVIVCMRLFNSVSANYPWEKSRITAYTKTTENVMNYGRLMAYLRDREVVAMLDYDSSSRIGFLVPCTHEDGIGFWYYTSMKMKQLALWINVLAARKIAAEIEATRIASEIEAARIAAEVEAARIAKEVEATRIAAMIARCDAFIVAKIEATRLSDAESTSAHRPVEQSPECKQVERERYEFMIYMNIIHNIWYLQGKNANESPPPQEVPARAAELLGNVLRFYAAHYAPVSQGEKSYTDPSTGGPTCKTNEIIQVFPTIAS
jgi:hypothetical protein